MFSLSLAALLLAAPAPGKQSAEEAAIQTEMQSVEKAADSAASAAEAANKAAAAAEKAAEAAAKAAESAAAAAEAAQKAVAPPAPPPAPAAPAAPAASAAAAAPAAPPVVWTSVINLGMISLTGNTQSLAFSFGGNVQRKSEEWIFGIKASANYGEARDNTSGIVSVNALAATVQLREDKRFSSFASAYLLEGIDTDHIKSIEERPYAEAGASIIWFDQKEGDFSKTSLRTDLGFRYGREYDFQYYPAPLNLGEVDIGGPHLGVSYRYALSKEIIFTDDIDVVASLLNQARMLLVNTAKVSARLSSSVNLAVSFVVNDDTLPPPPKQSVDTALTIGVEIAL